MKITITQTFTATKTTCGALVKKGQTEGRFMEPSDTKPLFVWQEYSWIQANPRKVIYLLSDEETTVEFQEKCGGTCCGGDYKCVCENA